MKSARPKSGLVRQQSVQQPPPKRHPLKKQLSDDQIIVPNVTNDVGVRVSFSAKAKPKQIIGNGPRARAAWGERKQNSADHVEVVAKKCQQHRQSRGLLTCDKDTMLYSRQELAERLRKAWRDKENGKQNLDIFLVHSNHALEPMMSDDQMDVQDASSEYSVTDKPAPIKTNPELTVSRVTSASPKTDSIKPKPILRPSTAPKPVKAFHFYANEQKENDVTVSTNDNSQGINNVTITPMTAAFRRSQFQNQARQSAFSGSTEGKGPPLQRAHSNPVNPTKEEEPAIKVIHKRKFKSRRKGNNRDRVGVESSDEEKEGERKNKGKKGIPRSRSVAVPGSDIVTMISLMSSTASDSENENDKKSKPSNNAVQKNIRKDNNSPIPLPYAQAQTRLASLRKTVSFQEQDDGKPLSTPSNIGSLSSSTTATSRCYSAMLSLRRGSVSPAGKMRERRDYDASLSRSPTGGSSINNNGDITTERTILSLRIEMSNGVGKLQRMDTVDCVKLVNSELENRDNELTYDKHALTGEINLSDPNTQPIIRNGLEANNNQSAGLNNDSNEEIPMFFSQKEKNCWLMYQRMLAKGVSVSYDTILRGMLTPTEYRLKKKCDEQEEIKNLKRLERENEPEQSHKK